MADQTPTIENENENRDRPNDSFISDESEMDKNDSAESEEDEGNERACWICFATEEENKLATWVQPCLCRGTTKWVHESCLYRWIDEKQKGNTQRTVVCQQCQTEYIILFPQMSRAAAALESIDSIIKRSSPYMAAGILVGSVYWTAITYGAITVIQVLGQQRGLELMENVDPVILLIGLPFIPVSLLLSRLINWEDAILRLIHRRHNLMRKFPLTKWMYNSEPDQDGEDEAVPLQVITQEPLYVSRIFCGAMLLPSVATLVGTLIFRNVENHLYRTLLGGASYLAVKGILKIYLRQKQHLRKLNRRIVDYTEDNLRQYMDNEPNTSARQDGGYDDYIELHAVVGISDDDDYDSESELFTEDSDDDELIL